MKKKENHFIIDCIDLEHAIICPVHEIFTYPCEHDNIMCVNSSFVMKMKSIDHKTVALL